MSTNAARLRARRRDFRRFFRPAGEVLEDRRMLSFVSNRDVLINNAAALGALSSGLTAGPLNKDLPVLSGGGGTLAAITGIGGLFSAVQSELAAAPKNDTTDTVAELNGVLQISGWSVTVTEGPGDVVTATFVRSLAGSTTPVNIAGNLADFGVGKVPYLTDIVSLGGSAQGTFNGGAQFRVTVQSSANVFAIKQDTGFDSTSFDATIPIASGAKVRISEIGFEVGVTGQAVVDLNNLDVRLNDDLTGGEWNDAAAHSTLSMDDNSLARLEGVFKLRGLGQDLLSWSAHIGFDLDGSGNVSGNAAITVTDAPDAVENQNAIQTQLLGTVAGALGFDRFGVLLNPFQDIPPALADVISFVADLLGVGLNSDSLDPQAGLSQATQGAPFQFADAATLLKIASGQGGDLATFTKQVQFLNETFTPPEIPLGIISIAGIVNIIPKVGVQLSLQGTASVGLGLSTKGVFVNTDQTFVGITTGIAGVFQLALNVIGVAEVGSFALQPGFKMDAKLKLDDELNGSPVDKKLYLSELGTSLAQQANTLGNLGDWLADAVCLDINFPADLDFVLTVNAPITMVAEAMPPGVSHLFAGIAAGQQLFFDFIGGAVETVCEIVTEIPILGGLAEEVLECETVRKVAQFAGGDYLQIVDEVFLLLPTEFEPSIEELNLQHKYTWSISLGNAGHIEYCGKDEINAGSATAANQSPPADIIKYEIINGNLLKITGTDDPNTVLIKDLGGGKIELSRATVQSGTTKFDPPKSFTGITAVDADLKGADDVLTIDAPLVINATVLGGSGLDKITTGAGGDTLKGGEGNDVLDSRDGIDRLEGENGDDVLQCGPGADKAFGGAGKDTIVGDDNQISGGDQGDELHGGSEDDDLFGGRGNDSLFGDEGNDRLFGGKEDDKLFGWIGDDTLLGEEGNDELKGEGDDDTIATGPGNDKAWGGDGEDEISGGSGNSELYGEAGEDEIFGGTGVSKMFGGPDKDLLGAGTGDDLMVGNGGNDVFAIVNPTASVLASLTATGLEIYGGDQSAADAGQDGDVIIMVLGGGAGFTETYSASSVFRTGTILTTDNTTTQKVGFHGVLNAVDLVKVGALVVNATDNANQLKLSDAGLIKIQFPTEQPPVEETAEGDTVQIDGTALLTDSRGILSYANKTKVRLQALGGDDTLDFTSGKQATGLVDMIVDGGAGTGDTATIRYTDDFVGSMEILGWESIPLVEIMGDFHGTMNAHDPGDIDEFRVQGSMTASSSLTADNIVLGTIGPDQLASGHDMAGRLIVSETLTELRVAGGTPGTIEAGHVGTVRAYGAYGPLALQIKEAGIQRRVELAVPSDPYPLPAPPPAPTPTTSPTDVLVQYFYRSDVLANPELTAKVVQAGSERYDLSLVVWNEDAKFNLTRLNAAGQSQIRNVAVEGDLLTAVSSDAASFFRLPGGAIDPTVAGVQLPSDNLSGVAVRDRMTSASVRAQSLMGVAFGELMTSGGLVTGAVARQVEAQTVPMSQTLIVQARDQFRVPFANNRTVALFFGSDKNGKQFDNKQVLFSDQGADDARGSVTALVGVNVVATATQLSTQSRKTKGAKSVKTTAVTSSVIGDVSRIDRIDLRGDHGAIQTQQWIVSQIQSSGPIGDVLLKNSEGFTANVFATAFEGNIEATSGAINGRLESTGLRLDPLTGITSPANADFGRLLFDQSGQVIGATVVRAVSGGITGSVISRGDLVSKIQARGDIKAAIATQGNLGAQVGTRRFGGIEGGGSLTGSVIVLGNVLGDLLITGGVGGRVAVRGNLASKVTFKGGIDVNGALIVGGNLGDAAAGLRAFMGNVKGIVAAKGTIALDPQTNKSSAKFFQAGITGQSAAAVDAIFTKDDNALLFDVLAPLDGLGLTDMLADLARLRVAQGQLIGTVA